MPPANMANSDSATIETMLKKQQELLEIIVKQNTKIKRHLFLMALGGYLRLALIIIPLILGFIFLPPLLNSVMKQYQDLLGVAEQQRNSSSGLPKLDVNEIQKLLKQFQQ